MGHPDSIPTDLAAVREEYALGGLDVSDLLPDPLEMFERWLREAFAARVPEPTAMVLGTVDTTGAPSSRTVLLKGIAAEGFEFFTGSTSAKGRDLAHDPRCSLHFGWYPVQRQVRVVGVAVPLPRAEVEAYFATRPRASQLGAWASEQSSPVADRAELERALALAGERFEGREVTAPPRWGGYRVRPRAVEFWQGRPGRLHDRFVYEPAPGAAEGEPQEWRVQRLAP